MLLISSHVSAQALYYELVTLLVGAQFWHACSDLYGKTSEARSEILRKTAVNHKNRSSNGWETRVEGKPREEKFVEKIRDSQAQTVAPEALPRMQSTGSYSKDCSDDENNADDESTNRLVPLCIIALQTRNSFNHLSFFFFSRARD